MREPNPRPRAPVLALVDRLDLLFDATVNGTVRPLAYSLHDDVQFDPARSKTNLSGPVEPFYVLNVVHKPFIKCAGSKIQSGQKHNNKTNFCGSCSNLIFILYSLKLTCSLQYRLYLYELPFKLTCRNLHCTYLLVLT
jgi:hypothetical protein